MADDPRKTDAFLTHLGCLTLAACAIIVTLGLTVVFVARMIK